MGYPAAVLRENEGTYTNVRVPGCRPSSERRAEKTDAKTDSKAAVPALRPHGDGGAPCHLNVPGALCDYSARCANSGRSRASPGLKNAPSALSPPPPR